MSCGSRSALARGSVLANAKLDAAEDAWKCRATRRN